MQVSSGPDFIGIGMQKTGTGWLYDQLQHHPAVWMPPVKELHYLTGEPLRSGIRARLQNFVSSDLASLNAARRRRQLRPLGQRDVDFCAALLATRNRDADLDDYEALFAAKGGQITGDITPSYSTMPSERVETVLRRF